MKLYLNKAARKAIETAMSKTQRAELKNGATFCAIIRRNSIRPLARWGWDDNLAFVTFRRNGEVVNNSLVNLTEKHWNNREEAAKNAIDYFIYGEKPEYSVFVIPMLDDDTFLTKQEAEKLELPSEYKYLLKACSAIVEYNDGAGTWYQHRLIRNESRHCGESEGCFWTPWVNQYGYELD